MLMRASAVSIIAGPVILPMTFLEAVTSQAGVTHVLPWRREQDMRLAQEPSVPREQLVMPVEFGRALALPLPAAVRPLVAVHAVRLLPEAAVVSRTARLQCVVLEAMPTARLAHVAGALHTALALLVGVAGASLAQALPIQIRFGEPPRVTAVSRPLGRDPADLPLVPTPDRAPLAAPLAVAAFAEAPAAASAEAAVALAAVDVLRAAVAAALVEADAPRAAVTAAAETTDDAEARFARLIPTALGARPSAEPLASF